MKGHNRSDFLRNKTVINNNTAIHIPLFLLLHQSRERLTSPSSSITSVSMAMETSFTSLFDDLVATILHLVVASSFLDLASIRLTCKRFLEVTESDYFYARMSLEHFTDFECQWHFPPPTLSRIFDNCLRNKNSDALFKKAVADYFRGKDAENAFNCLTETSTKGHAESSYAMAIIMLFRGSESKEEGMRLLKAMTETTTQRRDVKKYRFRVKTILRSVWVLNDTVRNQYRSLKICWRHRKRARRGWEPPMEEIDREDSNLLCVRCLCDEELYALGLCSD